MNLINFPLLLPPLITGLQSLWTTAICSSNLQQKYPITPPTTSISSDQLLQQTPISDKGKVVRMDYQERLPTLFFSTQLPLHSNSFFSYQTSNRLKFRRVLIKNPIKAVFMYIQQTQKG